MIYFITDISYFLETNKRV